MISNPYNPFLNPQAWGAWQKQHAAMSTPPAAINNNTSRPPSPASQPTPQFLGLQWYWWILILAMAALVIYLAFRS